MVYGVGMRLSPVMGMKRAAAKPRFGGGFLSNVASHVVGHLDQEYRWQHPTSPSAKQLRELLVTGLAVVNRTEPLLLDAVLDQFRETFPDLSLSERQTSLTREAMEAIIDKRTRQLAGQSDEAVFQSTIGGLQQLTDQQIAGAKSVLQAVMILEDVVQDKSCRLGGNN